MSVQRPNLVFAPPLPEFRVAGRIRRLAAHAPQSYKASSVGARAFSDLPESFTNQQSFKKKSVGGGSIGERPKSIEIGYDPYDVRWCINCDLPLIRIDRLWACPKPNCSPRNM